MDGMSEDEQHAEVTEPELVSVPVWVEDHLNKVLREAGIEYPLGLRGVRDLVNQRDGQLDRAQEAEDERDRAQQALMAKLTEVGQLREELAALRSVPPVDTVAVPLAALRELAREATLVASGFDELIPHDTHYQSKIANLIDALGVEGL